MIHKLRAPLALLSLVLTPVAAFALPGEASSVIAHCGSPISDYTSISPVTGQMERNLTYGNLILHFKQAGGSWGYMSAWEGHTPASEAKVTATLPCFHDALADVQKNVAGTSADPTLVGDQTQTTPGIHFGSAFLWLLALLAFALFISVALPSTRRRLRKKLPLEARPYRRPLISRLANRRAPAVAATEASAKPSVPRGTL